MSIANNSIYSQASPPAPTSNKGLLVALLGCGGGLLLFCCGSGVFLAVFLYNFSPRYDNKAVQQAVELATFSKEVRTSLGNKLTFGMPVNMGDTSSGIARFRVPIQGNIGRGDLEVAARFVPSENNYKMTGARVVTSVGKVITLK